MEKINRFTAGFYFQVLTGILKEPRRFFSEMPEDMKVKQPLGFLLISGIFFAGAGLVTSMPDNLFFWGGVYFINAVGMAFIAAGFGYIIMTIIIGKKVTFKKFFSVFAFSSGVTLLVSWIPFFIWITEPWKWWLIGTGMIRGFGFRRRHAVLIVGLTICIIILFFRSVLPLIALSE